MNTLKAHYAKVNINPMLGIGVAGYFVPRYASTILDDLEASALALSAGGDPVLLVSVDLCHLERKMNERFRRSMAEAAGIPFDNIFLTCTHTHTGPVVAPTKSFPVDESLIEEYVRFLGMRLKDLAVMAARDLKPARMGFIYGWAPDRVAYIRRYKMKDGSTWTCPPINDPNIDHPIGTLDQRVNVLRFDIEGEKPVVIMNYGVHADTINHDQISPDWPGWTRKTIAKALDGARCMCIVGAQGDVGSTHVFPSGGDMNDTEISFDNEMKSPGMARFVGRALAGTILQVYDKVEYTDVDRLGILKKTVTVAANVPDPKDLPRAHLYNQLHQSGHDDQIPYTAMELTTVVAEAARMCRLENGPESFDLELTGLRLGPVAFVGIPGEPFTEIGRQIKDTEGWSLILPCCLTNGAQGYFPMQDAFDEGGYEARSSNYKPGVAETIIKGGKELLGEMREKI
ncbi:MAG: hypothetical protein IK150_00355 [Lachnospiraceae bacterium]|nr:hypothetical protein [Lachnospiraceae bacterium]